jgi:hypothetical protein
MTGMMRLLPMRGQEVRCAEQQAVRVMQGLNRFNALFIGYLNLDERVLLQLAPHHWPDKLYFTYCRFMDAWRDHWRKLRSTPWPPREQLPTLFEHLITGLPKMGYPLCLDGLRC